MSSLPPVPAYRISILDGFTGAPWHPQRVARPLRRRCLLAINLAGRQGSAYRELASHPKLSAICWLTALDGVMLFARGRSRGLIGWGKSRAWPQLAHPTPHGAEDFDDTGFRRAGREARRWRLVVIAVIQLGPGDVCCGTRWRCTSRAVEGLRSMECSMSGFSSLAARCKRTSSR